jgi:L-threonylcarbamoyladenylate synthase
MIDSAYLFADGVELADEAVTRCASAVRSGALVGLPTETVYGLGANADDAQAVAQIFSAKGRPADHPLIVHIASFDGGMSGVAHYASRVPAFAQQLMSAFWPGPLTLILPRREGIGDAAAGGQASIGLRCPSHPVAQAVLNALRKPAAGQNPVWGIAAPSANRFGRVSPTTAAHVQNELGDCVPGGLLILDGGPCEMGIESTIVDCTRAAPVLLRPGSISSAQVEAACGRRLLTEQELEELDAQAPSAPRASGTLESHYAPNAKLRLMDAKALQKALDLLGTDLDSSTTQASIAVYARAPLKTASRQIVTRQMPANAAATAHELFSVLREFDDRNVKLIWVETPPAALEWDGVRDRLQRASA